MHTTVILTDDGCIVSLFTDKALPEFGDTRILGAKVESKLAYKDNCLALENKVGGKNA